MQDATGPRGMVQQLRALLAARDPDVRSELLDDIAANPMRREALLDALDAEVDGCTDTHEMTSAPILMARIGGLQVLPRLERHSGSSNPNVIAAVAEAISIIGDPLLDGLLDRLAANEDCVFEALGSARSALRARAALAKGGDAWAAIRPDTVVLNWHNLRQLVLCDADASGIRIEAADLRRCILERTRLRGAYLFRSDLCGASLKGADLTGADLVGACLRGADLTGAVGLSPSQLAESYLDGATRLPEAMR